MSLIHVASRTTSSEQDFSAASLSDQSLILVDTTATIESYSIELTIGLNWSRRYDQTDNAMFAIPGDGIAVPAGQSVVVEVAESLAVPHNMYGLIVPTGRLFLDRGIIIAAAKIEPSFNDRLKLRLVNISGGKRTLETGQKIASAIFFATEKTFYQDEVRKRVVVASQMPGAPRRVANWSRTNWPQLVTWSIALAALVISIIALVFTAPVYFSSPAMRTQVTDTGVTQAS